MIGSVTRLAVLVLTVLATVPHQIGTDSAASGGRFVTVTAGRLWVTDTGGSGVPIVLLHAATGSTIMWRKQVASFGAAGLRVIAYDRFGRGRSVLATTVRRSNPASDLQELVRALDLPTFHLLGTAAGGGVALEYAVSHGGTLRSLVVANSTLTVDAPDFELLASHRLPPEFTNLPIDFRELGATFRVSDPDGVRAWLDAVHGSEPVSAESPIAEDRQPLTWATVDRIVLPTLLIAGDSDWYAPLPIVRLFASHVKTSRTVVMSEVGHSGYWEQPEKFNQSVIDFVTKH